MKRGIFVLLLVVGFVILLGTSLIYIWKTNADSVTGEVITGEATSSDLAISISIVGGPSLTILNPENKTYLNNESLSINFTASGEETVWYNFDKTANTTITSSIFFNISQGSHTLYMFANNTDGNETAKNVTFSVNSTKFIISYNEYANSNKGKSTDFNASTYEDIQNLSNIVLENTGAGKINFNVAINVTNDLDLTDNKVDLDIHVNISSNRIELNSTALPNFNKSATLYLYNLTFSTPRILRDGAVCPSSICTQNSYSGNTLSFNVTSFTVYSSEETPTDAGDTGGGGTGGGGGGLSFTVSVDEIIISLKQGEIKTEEITIKNQVNSRLSFSVISDMGEFVKIIEENFELGPKEEKTIFIDFIAKENTIPELYLGNLFIETGEEKREIPITIEVESADALFDIKVEIPKEFRIIKPGDVLPVAVSIFNIKGPEPVDVEITYQIRDFKNEVLLENKETFTVEEKKNFIRNFKIPNNAKEGAYILYTTIVYNEKTASSTAQFIIAISLIRNILIFLFIIILMIIIIILYNTEKYFIKHLTHKKKV